MYWPYNPTDRMSHGRFVVRNKGDGETNKKQKRETESTRVKRKAAKEHTKWVTNRTHHTTCAFKNIYFVSNTTRYYILAAI